jgi:DNA-binding transcriptional MerR regulator
MPKDQIIEQFTVSEAAEYSDLTEAMVNYLCRTSIVVPSLSSRRGYGRRRWYSFGDVVILRGVARLLKAGVTVSRLGKALKALRRYHPEITPTSLPAAYLVTDGKQVFLRHSAELLESLTEDRQMAFAFVLEISLLRTEVMSRVRRRTA